MEPPQFSDIPAGYPQHAALCARDNAYTVFRKFRTLNVRSLLYQQCELLDLEAQLCQVDGTLNADKSAPGSGVLESRDAFATDPERQALVSDIRLKLSAYNAALLQYDQINSLPNPSNEHVNLLQSWIDAVQPFRDSNRDYLADSEVRGSWQRERLKFAREPRELATLQRSHDSAIARFFRRSPFALFYLEDIIEFGQGHKKRSLWFYPTSKISSITGAISIFLAVALNCIGMIVLHFETHTAARLGLIGLFTGLAAALLGFCGARKSEVMIGTIGYAAVLVVFVSADS